MMLAAGNIQLDRPLDWREPTTRAYFERLNANNFQGVAKLFAREGTFQPPFEDAIVGYDAIYTYLKAEADGIRAIPRQESVEQLPDGKRAIQISGEVQTVLFSVNASWKFTLNPNSEILNVTIELLASPQDLLGLQQFR